MNYKVGDIIDEYKLLRECGHGAFGTVFLAENQMTASHVAFKIIYKCGSSAERELKGLRQYQIIAQNTNLLQIYQVKEYDDFFYYTMDIADNLSDDEESAEKGRRLFIAFCPNRIVLFICNLAGLAIAVFPYCMRPIYGGVYSEHVVPVLEAPDSFGVGTLILALCGILSVISVIMEKKLDVDIFKKDKKTLEEEISELNSSESAEVDMNQEEVERIKNMFKKEKDNNK